MYKFGVGVVYDLPCIFVSKLSGTTHDSTFHKMDLKKKNFP